MQCACGILSSIARPGSAVFFHLINSVIFEKKKKVVEHIMPVLIYSTNLFEIFLILRRNNQDTIKMYIGLHIKYLSFWTDFNET